MEDQSPDFDAVGRNTWKFYFPSGKSAEEYRWHIIHKLENGSIMCVKKDGKPWEIPGDQVWFQLGLMELNTWGCAYTPSGAFGNAPFVAQNPEIEWIRVVDYLPIISEYYDPESQDKWIPTKDSVASKAESPIERLFATTAESMGLELETQIWIDKYRVDFKVSDANVVIELDGHEFHSTRQQRRKDAYRDRILTQKGFTVFRFTGDEVVANPRNCVEEIKRYLGKL